MLLMVIGLLAKEETPKVEEAPKVEETPTRKVWRFKLFTKEFLSRILHGF